MAIFNSFLYVHQRVSFWLATGCFKSKHHLPALLIPRQCLAFSFAELDGSQETQSCDVAWACLSHSIPWLIIIFPIRIEWNASAPWYFSHGIFPHSSTPMSEVPMRSLFRTCWRYLFHRRRAPKIWPFFRGWDDWKKEDMVLEETPVCPNMETIIVMIPKNVF